MPARAPLRWPNHPTAIGAADQLADCGHNACRFTAHGRFGKSAHGQATIAAFQNGRHPVARSGAQAGFSIIDQLSVVNVEVQADTLAAHPVVALAREQRQLEVIGLFYDISSAEVLLVTPSDVVTLTHTDHRA